MGKTFRREKGWDEDYNGYENRSFKKKKKKMKAQREMRNTRNYDDHEDSVYHR